MNKRIKKKIHKRYGIRKYSKYNKIFEIKKQMYQLRLFKFNESPNPFKVSFNDYVSVCETTMRHPNEIECRQYLINRLKKLRWDYSISIAQYRSVKGQIRRGYIDMGITFIVNHSDISEKELRDAYEKYKLTEIAECTIVYKPRIPVTYECIDIAVKE